MVRGLGARLRPGGRLAIETLTLEPVVARGRTVTDVRVGAVRLEERRAFDAARGRLDVTWRLRHGERSELKRYGLRLYGTRELSDLVEAAGLEVVGLDGDVEGSPFTVAADRCILRARRPGPDAERAD